MPCANGQAVPGIDGLGNLQNVQLKIKETLTTSDVHASPELQEVYIEIITSWGNIAYGPNKSTLTAWDSISLAWKPERLSLVVNDEEACYIENPGLPTALGSHIFIGTDRNGNNAINTLIDELRIDKVYRDVAIRTGWHKAGVPFYTSEDMKQWPGYLRAETDGLKVYDIEEKLRAHLGSWIREAVRRYGLKIIEGELYSSIVRSGAEDAGTYIQLTPPNALEVFANGKRQLRMAALFGGGIDFYRDGDPNDSSFFDGWAGTMSSNTSGADLFIAGVDIGIIKIGGDLNVAGNLSCTGSKPAQQVTENYGIRYMYATEAPEIIYYDRGRAQLVNGECTVYLDPIYLECIEPDTELTPWQIWVQCYGENDVYVSEIGADYFKVKERNGGTSNNKVVWKHEAIRNGYAGIRLMEVTN